MITFSKEEHIRTIQYLDHLEYHKGESKASHRDAYIDANAIDIDLDEPLYRIMPINRLFDILDNNRMCMVHPMRWDDPYEVFLTRSYGTTRDGIPVGFEPINNSLYGLCFSLKQECDGLWRNYTSNSCNPCSLCDWKKRHGKRPISVKIKTTGRKLMEAFYDVNNVYHGISYWIGKVKYCKKEDISKLASVGIDIVTDDTGVNLIESLLIKREAFEYEHEVRLLYYLGSQTPHDQMNTPDLYFFDVDPNKLIEEIEFSPWVSDNDVKRLSAKISRKYQGNVGRSKLYDEPGIHIRVI